VAKYDDIIGAADTIDQTWWMRAAQAAVRHYCGWHISPSVTETITVDGYGGRTLALPSKHVTAIASITISGTDVIADAVWSEAGTVVLTSGLWPDLPGSVQVSLTHGWDTDDVPDVAAIILSVAKRARTNPGAISSQSVNGASVNFATSSGVPLGVPLMQAEMDALAPYRLGARP
jgi:hypothetical protein